jgi:uncharacterized protein (DUF983 family)
MDKSEPSATAATAPGLRLLGGTCPRCGKGDLFTGALTLRLRKSCDRCGLDYNFADSGDGPAVFAIFILGFLVLGGALIAEFKFGAPVWAHVLLWGVLTPLIAFLLLRILKSRLISQQYRHKAGEARSDQFEP